MGHHFVPQRYLRTFESPERPGWIWMFDKKDESWRHLPIKQVAQAADFYDEDVEKELNELVEKPGGNAIDKIRAGSPVDETDRQHLSYYIGTMMRRVPYARAKGTKLIPGVIGDVVRETKEAFEEAARQGRITDANMQERLAEIAALETRFLENPPEQVTKQVESPWPYAKMLLAIDGMFWRVLQCRGPSFFVTSDNPASFFEGFGLGHIDCEVVLPLAKDLLLHCCWQRCPDMQRLEAPEQIVKEFNRRTASSAWRFVFYHAQADWVPKVSRATNQQLKRIRW